MKHQGRFKLIYSATFVVMFMASNAYAAKPLEIDVHRDANCGCCKKWIQHLKDNGFTVADHVETDMSSVKLRLGVTSQLYSCHTAVINGKFIEGHVPAEQIVALSNRDDLKGVAAPGMPAGSPGMEFGGRKDSYQVLGLTKAGRMQVVAEYPAKPE